MNPMTQKSQSRKGPAPGFRNHPDHLIEIAPATARWQARIGDEVLADSPGTLILKEANYPPVVYFPREDVSLTRLDETDTTTTCPFKGQAAYFAVSGAGDDIAWTYPDTYDEVAEIEGYVAFYTNKVSVTEAPG